VWRKERYILYGVTDKERFAAWRGQARRRGLETDLTFGQWVWLKRQSCVYKQGDVTVESGIDRIDSAKGYLRKNCQPCCPHHNAIKSDVFTHDQMLEIVTKYGIGCGVCRTQPSIRQY